MNKLFTPEELRKITDEAVEKAKAEKLKAIEKKTEERRLEQERQINRAQMIMLGLPEAARKAALEGKNSVILFRLKTEDYLTKKKYEYTTDLSLHLLDGAAEIVAETCVKAGYKVFIRYDWDGGGMDSWHNFVVEW